MESSPDVSTKLGRKDPVRDRQFKLLLLAKQQGRRPSHRKMMDNTTLRMNQTLDLGDMNQSVQMQSANRVDDYRPRQMASVSDAQMMRQLTAQLADKGTTPRRATDRREVLQGQGTASTLLEAAPGAFPGQKDKIE